MLEFTQLFSALPFERPSDGERESTHHGQSWVVHSHFPSRHNCPWLASSMHHVAVTTEKRPACTVREQESKWPLCAPGQKQDDHSPSSCSFFSSFKNTSSRRCMSFTRLYLISVSVCNINVNLPCLISELGSMTLETISSREIFEG